ncbi:MAG: PorT family protein [Bacteroidales bacterium]|jgi:hypothetical protein|nr:PorT family protein [Bacteroidales bacterium]
MKKLQDTNYKIQLKCGKLQETSNRCISLKIKSLIFKFLNFLFFSLLLSPFSSQLFSQPNQHQKHQKPNKSVYPSAENRKAYFLISFGPTVDWFVPTTKEFTLTRQRAKAGLIAGLSTDIAVIKDRYLYFSTGLMFRYLQGDLSFANKYYFSSLMEEERIFPTVRTFQTMYLTLPTGVKFRTNPSNGCVFLGKLGLYHNFKIGGSQFDNFILSNESAAPEYFIRTPKIINNDASLFAESVYIGLGFEYVLSKKARVFAVADYNCQFNYFSNNAINIVHNKQYKSVVHSLHIVFGVMF